MSKVTLAGGQSLYCDVFSPPVLKQPAFLDAPRSDQRRTALMLRNASTDGQTILIEFGKEPTADSVTRLAPGQELNFEAVPQHDLYAACDIAGGHLVIVEARFTRPPL